MTRVEMTENELVEMTNEVITRWPAYLTEYDNRLAMGHISREDYAPLADLATKVANEYRERNPLPEGTMWE